MLAREILPIEERLAVIALGKAHASRIQQLRQGRQHNEQVAGRLTNPHRVATRVHQPQFPEVIDRRPRHRLNKLSQAGAADRRQRLAPRQAQAVRVLQQKATQAAVRKQKAITVLETSRCNKI